MQPAAVAASKNEQKNNWWCERFRLLLLSSHMCIVEMCGFKTSTFGGHGLILCDFSCQMNVSEYNNIVHLRPQD